MFVVFSCSTEVIVTTPDNEASVIEEYFTKGGRDMDDYNRDIIKDNAIAVRPDLLVRF